jgi:hypothetical protein
MFKYIEINHAASNINNKLTQEIPAFLHGNGSTSVKLQLNHLENYLGNNWNKFYGYVDGYLYKNPINTEKVYLALIGITDVKINIALDQLSYDKKLLNVKCYPKLYNESIDDFLKSECEYYISWECNDSQIFISDIIQQLIPKTDKGFIAPLLTHDGNNLSNFWGELDDDGYYKRSEDYLLLLNRERKGLWNVPYITNFLITSRQIIQNNGLCGQSLYTNEIDLDMSICLKLRNKGIFMYLDNFHEYGRLLCH